MHILGSADLSGLTRTPTMVSNGFHLGMRVGEKRNGYAVVGTFARADGIDADR